jgi:transposase-like protein
VVGESTDEVPVPSVLVAGRDYPRTYREFVGMFPDAKPCADYLEQLRWPAGFVCPACGRAGPPWRQTRGRLVCPMCRHHTSVTAGTILDKTRTPLTTWFEAAWHVTTAKSGLSAKTLERTLGTRYRVAWTMLQRFRVAMVRVEREPLSGDVEVDETYVGGVERDRSRGRGATKSTVVVAVEIRRPTGLGRLRMRHVPDASSDSLIPFVCDTVARGAVVRTDGWRAYNPLADHGYTHRRTVLAPSRNLAHVSMPGVHRVTSLLKRWMLGTHQGFVTPEHLQAYLEEFTFRFNRRTARNRGLVFRRLLEQAIVTKPVTEADVTHGYKW